MGSNLTNYHRKPCANCGHRDMHGEVSGCIALKSTNPDAWCDCEGYVEPRNRRQDAREGQRRAQEGIDNANASYAMTSPDGETWKVNARQRIDALLASGNEFTAEDVTDAVGVAPSPSAIGGLFRAKEFKDRAVLVRIDTATRAVAHGRPLRVWKAKPKDQDLQHHPV
jgi:hypothetical protein